MHLGKGLTNCSIQFHHWMSLFLTHLGQLLRLWPFRIIQTQMYVNLLDFCLGIHHLCSKFRVSFHQQRELWQISSDTWVDFILLFSDLCSYRWRFPAFRHAGGPPLYSCRRCCCQLHRSTWRSFTFIWPAHPAAGPPVLSANPRRGSQESSPVEGRHKEEHCC